jgi:hypothetical protein
MHWARLAKDQPAEITIVQISEVQESPAFNGRRSFLTLRHLCQHWQNSASTGKQAVPDLCQHWHSSASMGPRSFN